MLLNRTTSSISVPELLQSDRPAACCAGNRHHARRYDRKRHAPGAKRAESWRLRKKQRLKDVTTRLNSYALTHPSGSIRVRNR
jgi:hypothetical protein